MTSPARKRGLEEGEELGDAQSTSKLLITEDKPIPATNTREFYSCKTCNKEFKSFQALGFHQASHNFKNPELVGADLTSGPVPRKVYECRFCPKKFDMAQALGGHMTKHRSSGMQGKAKSESSKEKTVSGDLIIFKTKLICGEKLAGGKELGDVQSTSKFLITEDKPIPATNTKDVYSCKSCNRKFKSHQALGGHRASYNFKNPISVSADPTPGPVLRKVYECQICHEKLDSGQALGGHMTRHRSSGKEEKANFESSKEKLVSGDVIIFKTKLICGEKFAGDESRSDSSTLVTRDAFPREPLRVQAVPSDIWPSLEGDDLDLDLKVGP